MNLILLLGGQGRRFQWKGYTTPKHLLPMLDHKPLLAHILERYAPCNARYFVPIRESYNTPELQTLFPSDTSFYPLYKDTDGPVDSMATSGLLQNLRASSEDCLVADCDSWLDPQELLTGIAAMRRKATAGSFTRQTTDPGCAFVHIDAQGYAQEIREKVAFTPTSITGPYWWTTAHALIRDIEDGRRTGTLSIALLLNFRIKRHLKSVWLVPTTTFQHLGTPQTYETYRAEHLCPTL